MWGNKTDLSLHADKDPSLLASAQATASNHSAALNNSYKSYASVVAFPEDKILSNDLTYLWQHRFEPHLLGADAETTTNAPRVSPSNRLQRIDIVLDNAGMELFTDFCLADWLCVAFPDLSEILFHVKEIPWFVSDTMRKDITWLLSHVPAFLHEIVETGPTHRLYAWLWGLVYGADVEMGETAAADLLRADTTLLMKTMTRWSGYFEHGRWRLANDHAPSRPAGHFWTSPFPYAWMRCMAPTLHDDLCRHASLVIFKGDLNYRKLTFDASWSVSTPFSRVVSPVFEDRVGILALRTLKANTVVGLPDMDEARLPADWMVSGEYAVIQYSPGK